MNTRFQAFSGERVMFMDRQTSFYRKREHAGLIVASSSGHDDRWEVRLVDRVGEMARLEANAAPLLVLLAAGAFLPLQEVARVDLYAGLRGRYRQRAARCRIAKLGGKRRRLLALG